MASYPTVANTNSGNYVGGGVGNGSALLDRPAPFYLNQSASAASTPNPNPTPPTAAVSGNPNPYGPAYGFIQSPQPPQQQQQQQQQQQRMQQPQQPPLQSQPSPQYQYYMPPMQQPVPPQASSSLPTEPLDVLPSPPPPPSHPANNGSSVNSACDSNNAAAAAIASAILASQQQQQNNGNIFVRIGRAFGRFVSKSPWLFIFLVCLVVASAVMAYWQYRKNQQLEAEQRLLQERLRADEQINSSSLPPSPLPLPVAAAAATVVATPSPTTVSAPMIQPQGPANMTPDQIAAATAAYAPYWSYVAKQYGWPPLPNQTTSAPVTSSTSNQIK